MDTKNKSIPCFLFILMVLIFLPVFNNSTVSAQRFVLVPDSPAPLSPFQDGYNYGYDMGKKYASNGEKVSGFIISGTESLYGGRGFKYTFKEASFFMPNKEAYNNMSGIFYNAKMNALDNNMFQYYDGALQGIYDGFRFNSYPFVSLPNQR